MNNPPKFKLSLPNCFQRSSEHSDNLSSEFQRLDQESLPSNQARTTHPQFGRLLLLMAIAILAVVTSGCNYLIYVPTKEVYAHPSNFGLDHEEINFKSPDGININAWLFRPRPGIEM